jgi:hypothetical protein
MADHARLSFAASLGSLEGCPASSRCAAVPTYALSPRPGSSASCVMPGSAGCCGGKVRIGASSLLIYGRIYGHDSAVNCKLLIHKLITLIERKLVRLAVSLKITDSSKELRAENFQTPSYSFSETSETRRNTSPNHFACVDRW